MPQDDESNPINTFDREPATSESVDQPHYHQDSSVDPEPTSRESSDGSKTITPPLPVAAHPNSSHFEPAQHPQAQLAASPTTATAVGNTPGVLVLQWLTYAFWGWALIALYWMSGVSISYYIDQANRDSSDELFGGGSFLAYSLAATIVLFIIALICDVIYSRKEPVVKTGAATVIMVIHAVIFALAAIGTVIVGVFAIVAMLIDSGFNQAAVTTLLTATIMAFAYGAMLVRTLRPKRIKNVVPMYWGFISFVTLVIIALGIIGPVANAQRTKGDRQIEAGLTGVANGVNDYAKVQRKLPASLKNISVGSYEQDSKQLIDSNSVKYTPLEQVNRSSVRDSSSATDLPLEFNQSRTSAPVFHYKLCVTYTAEKKADYTSSFDNKSGMGDNQYSVQPVVSSHKAGNVCYDLQTDYVY